MRGRTFLLGDHVQVREDGTGEFTDCVGKVSYLEDPWYGKAFIGVAFGKASNTFPLPSGKWGAWFSRNELRLTKEDISPICPTPVE